MPEIHENTIGNKICQLFIEGQIPEDRTLANIYTDVAGHIPCECTSPNVCPASQGFIHELLSTHLRLTTGITGTEGAGLYPSMYSIMSKPIPIASRGLVLQEAKIDARNYILKFKSRDGKECWVQVRELKYLLYLMFANFFITSLKLQPLTHTVVQIYTGEDWHGSITKVNKNVSFYCPAKYTALIANLGSRI